MEEIRAEDISIEAVQGETEDVRALIGELDRTLAQQYSPEQRHGLRLGDLFQPHVRFFLARMDGIAVGCGGVALFEKFGEVKRMYVRDVARGRGVAQALLSRIEEEAQQSGLRVLRLETGNRQLAAMRLYERAGFRQCSAFGDYAAMEPFAVATSVFFEKQIVSRPRSDVS